MLPTHRLYGSPRYINSRPSIFGDTFLFLLLLLSSYTFFLSAWDNETIRNQLISGKSPLALHVSHFSFCVLKNCRHSHRQSPVFPIRWFICGEPPQYPHRPPQIPTTCCHQLLHLTHTSATLAQYFATFRPFWWLFYHNRYILTNLATFFEKTLAIVWKMSPVLPREREVWLSRHSVASLGVYSVQWAAEKQCFQQTQ